MHKPESVQENETHKILSDFEIQTHHLFSDRKWDLGMITKKKRAGHIVEFVVPTDDGEKNKDKNRGEYLDLVKELQKLWTWS